MPVGGITRKDRSTEPIRHALSTGQAGEWNGYCFTRRLSCFSMLATLLDNRPFAALR